MGKIKVKKIEVGKTDSSGIPRYGYCDVCEDFFKEGFEYHIFTETKDGVELFLLCEKHFQKLFEKMKKFLEERSC
jgi:hypothetical protein